MHKWLSWNRKAVVITKVGVLVASREDGDCGQ